MYTRSSDDGRRNHIPICAEVIDIEFEEPPQIRGVFSIDGDSELIFISIIPNKRPTTVRSSLPHQQGAVLPCERSLSSSAFKVTDDEAHAECRWKEAEGICAGLQGSACAKLQGRCCGTGTFPLLAFFC